jgi:transposase
MGGSPAATASAQVAPWWTRTAAYGPPPRPQGHFLRHQDRVPVAHDPHEYWQCTHDLWLFPPLAAGRRLGTRDGHPAQWERQSQGRLPEPSACCADSQSIKTATQGEDVGFDGHKKIKGRKRHILVDTLGLIVAVVVTAANMDDRLGLVMLLKRYFAPGVTRLRKIWVDGGYEAQWLCDWVRGLKQTHKVKLEVVEHTGKGFQVVKHRWKVERSHL